MKLNVLIFLSLSAWLWSAQASGSCSSTNVRYASSSNILYLQTGGVCGLGEISAFRPQQLVNQGGGVYLLKTNLKLTDGSVLLVDGDDLVSPVSEFRLLSNNTGATNSVVNITADYGTVQINNTKITSWNEAVQGPDTEYGTYKRAYIRVRSSTVDKQSRMDISNSDIGYLGYSASESYGLTWKVTGPLTQVRVFGNIINSRIHHNYFGVFTYGAYGMMISDNEVDHNVKYGLDPHDDSDYLSIIGNSAHHNGNHGIICSQRCDNLVIRDNSSYSNTGHGIMLHRSVDHTLVENNLVFDNTDTGIALFESNNNVLRGNIVQGNVRGIRLSVGSSNNQIEGNMIFGNSGNSIYTYQGSDTPARAGNDGINRNNSWFRNTVTASGNYILKLSATDQDSFSDNDFTGNPDAKFSVQGATNTSYTNNLLDPGMTLP
ncbi:right-handed parallel beta-helix repeat-containing protein [Tolumonas auensis]|uniref:right-handed parallel beta-helix repeat-containing protein n=1 Tax=Tolumonas auensis TaxID=43948 RepID=UPI002AA6EC7A|nr:right-handed parallel beta-helix repeat-containing protein [Tolumonas auensis]